LDGEKLHVSASYAFTEATFQTPLLLNTNSPAADANGNEQVEPGDRIPGIPKHRANLVVNYSLSDYVTVGGSVEGQSGSFRFGDEANLTPPLDGYTIVDLNASYSPRKNLTFFAVLNNAFDKHYYTYGSFAPVSAVPWPNVPGGVTDPSTASPGTPITIYAGVRATL
jgi:iron complex outermembrane receptor protein